jgi:hypothetical protein
MIASVISAIVAKTMMMSPVMNGPILKVRIAMPIE